MILNSNLESLGSEVVTLENSLPTTSTASVTITLNGASGSVRMYKYGRIVYAYMVFTGALAAIDTLYNFSGTIPSGYRPVYPVTVAVNAITSNKVSGAGRITFAQNGAIQITGSVAASREWLVSTCWHS